ncbi:AAA family ATPase [candidate division WOR-3 bacterium]|nr:AAA family ATPase [candidate division WOR-3 bacterium]
MDYLIKDDAFVGRQKELQILKNCFEQAVNFKGKTVLIKGESGVGKTSLLRNFSNFAETGNKNVLTVQSFKDDIMDYSPFIRAVERFIDNLEFPLQALPKLLGPDFDPVLSQLVPRIREIFPVNLKEKDKKIDRTSVLLSFYRFFLNLSKMRPLVLLIDDIHFMNNESLNLLRYIIKRISDEAVLAIVTSRKHEPDSHLIIFEKDLIRESFIMTLELGPLSEAEVKNLLEDIFKIDYMSDFYDWLFSVTGGNPLFVEKIIEVMTSKKLIFFDKDKNEWSIDENYRNFQIPETLDSILESHLSELSPKEKKVAETAAVSGDKFDKAILNEFYKNISQKTLNSIFQRLKELNLIVFSESEGTFTHPLIRELVYERMEIDERRKTHRKLAVLLKNRKGHKDKIARHITEDLSEDEKTPELVEKLYNIAKDFFDDRQYKLARDFMFMAKKISSEINISERQKILIEYESRYMDWLLGINEAELIEKNVILQSLYELGLKEEAAKYCRIQFHNNLSRQNLKEAELFLEKAFTLIGEKTEMFWILSAEKCLLLRRKGLLNESVKLSKRILEKVEEEKVPFSVCKILSNLGLVMYLKLKPKKAREYFVKALSISRENNILNQQAECLSNMGLVEVSLGSVHSALSNLNMSLEIARNLELEQLISINLFYIGNCYEILGSLEPALKYFDYALNKAEKIDNARLIVTIQVHKVILFIQMEDFVRAEALIEKIDTKYLDKVSYCSHLINKSFVAVRRGDAESAERFIDEALRVSKKTGNISRHTSALSKKSIIFLKNKKKSKAMEYFEKARNVFKKNNDLLGMKSLCVEFGLELGGKKGEMIFNEGMDVLFKIKAGEALKRLLPSMRKAKFNKSIKKVYEFTEVVTEKKMEVRTFGGLSLIRQGELEPVSSKEWKLSKTKELFAHLILSRSSVPSTREFLITELWPDRDPKKGRNNLRVALNQLIKVIGSKSVISGNETVSLNYQIVEIDYMDFEKTVKEWKSRKSRGSIHSAESFALRAVEIYRGFFLPEFYFDRALEKQRELQAKMREVLFWLSELDLMRADYKKALDYAQKLIAMDSTDEQAIRIIMHCLNEQGDRVGAIKHYEFIKDNLKKEYEIDPSPETVELYEKIRSGKTKT